MDVILSVKPKYVNAILKGEKRYEFRKKIFRKPGIHRFFIYSSSPVRKIVASFESGEILEAAPLALWKIVKEYAGIDEREFSSYFAGRSQAYAIEILNLQVFDAPIDPKAAIPDFIPPQSFSYIDALQTDPFQFHTARY